MIGVVAPAFDGKTVEPGQVSRLDAQFGGVNDALSRFLPAGFYYKTFMWPPSPRWWLRYEHAIRRMAGMGRVSSEPDPDTYEHQYAHCDVLVVGAGPAGLTAAREAASSGASVIVCDEQPPSIGEAIENVTILSRTTVFGKPCFGPMVANRPSRSRPSPPPNVPIHSVPSFSASSDQT